jgi:large subunit ribosomal protein L17
MRHNKKFNHLGRKSAHRKAMLSNMANSLIFHKRIATTEAKAKALRMYVEPLITKAKNDTTHSRRTVFSFLKSKTAVAELFRDVAEKVGDRPGGYTRILKTGTRLGDSSDMCIIELVDYNESMLASTEDKTKKRRSRRGGAKGTEVKTEVPAAKKEIAVEKAKPEVAVEEEVKTEEAVAETVAEVPANEAAETEETSEETKVDEEEKKAE